MTGSGVIHLFHRVARGLPNISCLGSLGPALSSIALKISDTLRDASHWIRRIILFDEEMAHSRSYRSVNDFIEIQCPIADFGEGSICRHILQMHQTKSRLIRPQISNGINIALFCPIDVQFEFHKSVVCMSQQEIKGPDPIG